VDLPGRAGAPRGSVRACHEHGRVVRLAETAVGELEAEIEIEQQRRGLAFGVMITPLLVSTSLGCKSDNYALCTAGSLGG
jgi:hypothetical protein